MKDKGRDINLSFDREDENISPKIKVGDKEIPLKKMKFRL